MLRRQWLLGTTALIVTACASGDGTATPANLIAYAKGIEAGLRRATASISVLYPKVLPPTGPPGITSLATVTAWLDAVKVLTDGLTSATPPATGAATLDTIEKYFNLVLDAVAAVTPALAEAVPSLAPAVGLIQAAVVLLPIIEAFIHSIPAAASTPARAAKRSRALAPTMTEAEARARLGIK